MDAQGSGPDAGDLIAGHILGVDHVGVAVADLDAAVARYSRLLGLVEVHREVNAAQGVVEVMLVPAAAVGRSDAIAMQILAPLDDSSALHTFLDRRGAGLQQLAYRVDDLDATMAVLRSAGVRLLDGAPATGTAGSRIAFVHPRDAGGVLIELVERTG
ncbi:MAG TPA: methylmalonyl-CoA epimerase [Actinopolymorphaceae bacterium]|jgi:methylmalonyl-CoA/ethylmalonyl-CoA epimerase